ncbi:hypothetical protein ACFW16_04105 [Inquilinus sp. NPDC058860]
MTEDPRIRIRPARPEDLPAIVRMLADDALRRDRDAFLAGGGTARF